jgi:hypothetical protein
MTLPTLIPIPAHDACNEHRRYVPAGQPCPECVVDYRRPGSCGICKSTEDVHLFLGGFRCPKHVPGGAS